MTERSQHELTPAQYHAGLDKLWSAMPDLRGAQQDDVFTIAARRLNLHAELLEACQNLLAQAENLLLHSDCSDEDRQARRAMQNVARAAIAKAK